MSRSAPLDAATLARLIERASETRENAYAPYSKYRVGAALLTASGAVFTGCNFENASYPAGICAERGAVAQMIAAGEREPIACVIVTAGDEPAAPCGICRQVLVEFARDLRVVLVGLREGKDPVFRHHALAALLPEAFELLPRSETKRAAPGALKSKKKKKQGK
ncbi:MAG: cytidine deaminase [Polyangiaceae bacterium]